MKEEEERARYLDEVVLDVLEMLSKRLSDTGHQWTRDEIDAITEASVGCAMLRHMREHTGSNVQVFSLSRTVH